jgi:hypothetical protein
MKRTWFSLTTAEYQLRRRIPVPWYAVLSVPIYEIVQLLLKRFHAVGYDDVASELDLKRLIKR